MWDGQFFFPPLRTALRRAWRKQWTLSLQPEPLVVFPAAGYWVSGGFAGKGGWTPPIRTKAAEVCPQLGTRKKFRRVLGKMKKFGACFHRFFKKKKRAKTRF